MAAGGGLRYTIAVSKFENNSNWRGRYEIGDAWGAVLTDSLNQTGKFMVLGEKDMRMEAMEEQDFAASGRAAGGGKTVPTGQMAAAQLLVKGAITHFADGTAGGGGGISIKGFRIGAKGGKAEINTLVYVIDATTGIVVASKKCYGELSETGLALGLSRGYFSGDVGGFKKTNAGKAVEKAVDEAVAFIVSTLDDVPWTGKVIRVKGGKVFINRGTREGVMKGQLFVVGEADILRDPDTGELLDQSLKKVASIKVVRVKEKISICKVTEGAGVERGMSVVYED
jgi:curli biogenesis system outer membrane secretion channel CsgG